MIGRRGFLKAAFGLAAGAAVAAKAVDAVSARPRPAATPSILADGADSAAFEPVALRFPDIAPLGGVSGIRAAYATATVARDTDDYGRETVFLQISGPVSCFPPLASREFIMPLDLSPFDVLRAWLAPAVADEAAESILAPAVERCPKETETAANSGRVVVEGQVVYVTFGKDDDRNPLTGQPSNAYIVPLHEDNERQHPNGEAHFLISAADDARPDFAARLAARRRP